VAALIGWAGAALALHLPTPVTQALIGVAAIGVVIGAVASVSVARAWLGPHSESPRRRGARIGAIAASGLLIVLVPLLPRLIAARTGPVARLGADGASVTLELTLDEDPRAIGAGPGGTARIVCVATVRELVRGGSREGLIPGSLRGRVLVMAPAQGWAGLLPGQRVRVEGKLAPAGSPDLLSALLLTSEAAVPLGEPPVWQRGAGDMREALQQAVVGLPPGPRGLLPGLVVGTRAGWTP
jgi:competence protein ComEC